MTSFMGWSTRHITEEMWDCMAQMFRQGDLAWDRDSVDRAALELEQMGVFAGYEDDEQVDFIFTESGQRFAEEMLPDEYR